MELVFSVQSSAGPASHSSHPFSLCAFDSQTRTHIPSYKSVSVLGTSPTDIGTAVSNPSRISFHSEIILVKASCDISGPFLHQRYSTYAVLSAFSYIDSFSTEPEHETTKIDNKNMMEKLFLCITPLLFLLLY